MEIKIIDKIMRNSQVTFVEIEEIFDECGFDYKGEYAIRLGQYKNVYLWAGWSQEAIDLIRDIMIRKSLIVYECNFFIYLLEGKQPDWPIAKRRMDYKTERWIPSVLKVDSHARK